MTYSDIMVAQEWIALDYLNECIIGDVAKIEEFNKEYYILDKTIQRCVFVFDERGKYLRRIGRIGQGPGEYAQIYDFTINRKTGCVAILSELSKVYKYDLQGEFQSTKFQRSKYRPHSAGLSDLEIDMKLTEYFVEKKLKNLGTTHQPIYTPVPGNYRVSVAVRYR